MDGASARKSALEESGFMDSILNELRQRARQQQQQAQMNTIIESLRTEISGMVNTLLLEILTSENVAALPRPIQQNLTNVIISLVSSFLTDDEIREYVRVFNTVHSTNINAESIIAVRVRARNRLRAFNRENGPFLDQSRLFRTRFMEVLTAFEARGDVQSLSDYAFDILQLYTTNLPEERAGGGIKKKRALETLIQVYNRLQEQYRNALVSVITQLNEIPATADLDDSKKEKLAWIYSRLTLTSPDESQAQAIFQEVDKLLFGNVTQSRSVLESIQEDIVRVYKLARDQFDATRLDFESRHAGIKPYSDIIFNSLQSDLYDDVKLPLPEDLELEFDYMDE